MNTPSVDAGRLERRVSPVGSETMPGIHGFALFIHSAHTRITAIGRYRVDIVGCADEGGASFANDGLRKLIPSYGPQSRTGHVIPSETFDAVPDAVASHKT